MALNFTDARAFLVRNLIRQVYNMPANSVRPADQAAPVGKVGDEFATVKIVSDQMLDFDFVRHYVNDETEGSTKVIEAIDGLYEFTASIQFFRHGSPVSDSAGISPFGMGAYDKAVRLEARLALSPYLELMDKFGLTLTDVSPARNLSGLVDGAYYEDRGSVDLTFTISNAESIAIESIASAEIFLTVQQSGHFDTATIEVQP